MPSGIYGRKDEGDVDVTEASDIPLFEGISNRRRGPIPTAQSRIWYSCQPKDFEWVTCELFCQQEVSKLRVDRPSCQSVNRIGTD